MWLMWLGMSSTGTVAVILNVPMVHQKTGEFEKIPNFMKILISAWDAASRK